MEVDVEALIDSLEDVVFERVVVAGIDGADSVRPALLGSFDCSPEDALTATASIAEGVQEANYTTPIFGGLGAVACCVAGVALHRDPVGVFWRRRDALSRLELLLIMFGLGQDQASSRPGLAMEVPCYETPC